MERNDQSLPCNAIIQAIIASSIFQPTNGLALNNGARKDFAFGGQVMVACEAHCVHGKDGDVRNANSSSMFFTWWHFSAGGGTTGEHRIKYW